MLYFFPFKLFQLKLHLVQSAASAAVSVSHIKESKRFKQSQDCKWSMAAWDKDEGHNVLKIF